MRFSFFVFVVLILTTCKYSNVNVKESLIGKWELRKTIIGADKVSKSFPPGNGITIAFTDTTYIQFANKSMTSMGRYKFVQDTIGSNEIVSIRIIFKPEIYAWDTTKFFIDFEKNQLIIGADSIGALISYYERIK